MSIGCIIKAVVGAAVLAVAGYFVVPFVGIDQNMPLGSVLAVGLFVGCLVGVFFRVGSFSFGGAKNAGMLYVGNIPFAAREDEVQRLFETCGTVKSVRLVRGGPNRRPKGYGFVQMDTADVQTALSLNGTEFAGRKLRVSEAREKKEY